MCWTSDILVKPDILDILNQCGENLLGVGGETVLPDPSPTHPGSSDYKLEYESVQGWIN